MQKSRLRYLPAAECLPQQGMAGMKGNLIDPEGREVLANIVVAVSVFFAQIARQRRDDAERRKRKQAAVRYLVDAMAEGEVSLERQPANLFAGAGLQARIVTASTGMELVHTAEALIERPIVGEGCEAAVTHGLIAVQLHLIGLLHGARTDII